MSVNSVIQGLQGLILNRVAGKGLMDADFNANSRNGLQNKKITQKFNSVDSSINELNTALSGKQDTLTVASADLSSTYLLNDIKCRRYGNVVTLSYRGAIENLVVGEKIIGSLTSNYAQFRPSENISCAVENNVDNGGEPILVTIYAEDHSISYYNYGTAHTGNTNFNFTVTYIVD